MLETIAAPLKTADYDAFLAGLEALGYGEARDFKIEYRSADGHPDRFPKLVLCGSPQGHGHRLLENYRTCHYGGN